ncbi:MAG: UDP-2,3-diacylglucosamine diphosphatase [Deltaproteobacteria bacterium]|nr:UDP-2,3-diacylglucosamine diphosphatase [Deltaproteobacteria bacterium]
MKAVFLSDAHLKGPGDASQDLLLRFLGGLGGPSGSAVPAGPPLPGEPLRVDRLVVAGDFFDFWFARGGRVYPGFKPVIDRLAALKDQGLRISLCEGNHDFFLADYFTRELGIEVFEQWADLEMDGLRVLVSHGDTVDRENLKYLALRNFLRSSFARSLQGVLPLAFLWGVARRCSRISKRISGQSMERLAALMYAFALGKFSEGYDAVALGHCHEPQIRETRIAGRPKTFAILGEWDGEGTYLLYDNGRFTLNRYPA